MDISEQIRLEEYKGLKEEIFTTIKQEFAILAATVSGSAVVFGLMGSSLDLEIGGINVLIVICLGLLFPAVISFCGILWMDQLYRHRRLAVKIYEIEETCGMDGITFGWEHFIRTIKDNNNSKSRFRYYDICEKTYIIILCISFALLLFYSISRGNIYCILPCLSGAAFIVLEIIAFARYKASIAIVEKQYEKK